ncbi:MAG: twin-arginine translocase TatA/TatE family subunit [Verrucomicrobiota bacterium]
MNSSIAFIQNFNFAEIAIVLFVIVLLFGAKRLPELFGSIGKSITEFKRGMHETVSEVETELEQESKTAYKKQTKSA